MDERLKVKSDGEILKFFPSTIELVEHSLKSRINVFISYPIKKISHLNSWYLVKKRNLAMHIYEGRQIFLILKSSDKSKDFFYGWEDPKFEIFELFLYFHKTFFFIEGGGGRYWNIK